MNRLLPGSIGSFLGFLPPNRLLCFFCTEKDTGVLEHVLFKLQKLFCFLLRFLSQPFTLMSDCLRSLWIHQGNLCCLLVLILLIFNMMFQSDSHVAVSACVEHEGRSKCTCLHVWRVHNTLFLVWKGRYNCMVLCIFIKIADLVWAKCKICLY